MSRPLNRMNPGLNAIRDTDFMHAALAAKNGTRTLKQFYGDIRPDLELGRAEAAFETLQADGLASDASGKVALTSKGAQEAETRFGKLPAGKKAMEHVKKVVMPALALGIEPRRASRLAKADNLRAVALSVVFGLPLDKEKATLTAVNSALLVRGMVGLIPAADPRLASVAQQAGDISKGDGLARMLLKAGLALGQDISSSGHEKTERITNGDLAAFARKVQTVADKLSTPPFSRKVAIGQLYDAYGRENSDAGSLQAFKMRLLQANADGFIRLHPLDEPEALDAELRSRSVIETSHTRYHFIARS
jgi:hypothetical protein